MVRLRHGDAGRMSVQQSVHQVDLWLWSLDMPDDQLGAMRRFMTDDEIARAERFVNPVHRDMHIAGRGRLREILGVETGRNASDIIFEYGRNNKPTIAGGPHFNLSHSGGLAALAISRDGALGLDIEEIRPIEDSVARHFFTSAEYSELAQLSPDLWLDGFFRCWTRKEAVIKAVGLGLSMPLASFDVTLTPEKAPEILRFQDDDAAAWKLVHFSPATGLVGALAARTDGRGIVLNWHETL